MALAENLKKLREVRGWSQYELADAAGVEQSGIWRIENGAANPRKATLKKLAAALNVDPGFLEYGEIDTSVVPAGRRRIPVISEVQAGVWTEVSPTFLTEEDFRNSVLGDISLSAAAFAMIVRGRSMEPEFRDGDQIIVEVGEPSTPGDYVIAVEVEDGQDEPSAVFKQYAEVGHTADNEVIVELRSLNPLFPTWNSQSKRFRIVGKVVENTRKFKK